MAAEFDGFNDTFLNMLVAEPKTWHSGGSSIVKRNEKVRAFTKSAYS
jgi:hypothetical protein